MPYGVLWAAWLQGGGVTLACTLTEGCLLTAYHRGGCRREIKALTIRQPWASLIAAGVKTIETRSWSTRYRGPLLIHAGKARPGHGEVGEWCFDDCGGDRGWLARTEGHDGYTGDPIPEVFGDLMPLGAAVAVADLVAVVRVEEIWHLNRDGDAEITADERRDMLIESGMEFDQRDLGDFTPGRYAWLLDNVRPLNEPIPAKGKQGLWTPDRELVPA